MLGPVMSRLFYGWRIVAACLVAAMFANALGLFGAGVYLHVLIASKGWSTGTISSSITLFYVTSALLLVPVGGIIGRAGPRPIFAVGAVALAAGVAAIGQVTQPWQTYVVFVVMGVGVRTSAAATALVAAKPSHPMPATRIGAPIMPPTLAPSEAIDTARP